ncbi:MAG: hypothetical protein GTO02_03005 [Candidatus Dadabacteria bacterium]|nr:hypothetical protein [Candidatus Dadabacteria bacterium]
MKLLFIISMLLGTAASATTEKKLSKEDVYPKEYQKMNLLRCSSVTGNVPLCKCAIETITEELHKLQIPLLEMGAAPAEVIEAVQLEMEKQCSKHVLGEQA